MSTTRDMSMIVSFYLSRMSKPEKVRFSLVLLFSSQGSPGNHWSSKPDNYQVHLVLIVCNFISFQFEKCLASLSDMDLSAEVIRATRADKVGQARFDYRLGSDLGTPWDSLFHTDWEFRIRERSPNNFIWMSRLQVISRYFDHSTGGKLARETVEKWRRDSVPVAKNLDMIKKTAASSDNTERWSRLTLKCDLSSSYNYYFRSFHDGYVKKCVATLDRTKRWFHWIIWDYLHRNSG